jgi:hypothetical protein
MPVSDFHGDLAAVVLRAIARFGFALGGGNALLAHGVTDRLTQDVDLFTNRQDGVAAAAGAVEASLAAAGYAFERQDMAGDLAGIFEGMGEGLAEWTVTAADGQQTTLQVAYFGRTHQAVPIGIGPVLDLDDVVGGKVCALASRAAERDYIDVAAALDSGYSVPQIIGLALALDPGLTAEDFAEAGQRLDKLDSTRFARYGLGPDDVARLRKRLKAWPREPGNVPGARTRR